MTVDSFIRLVFFLTGAFYFIIFSIHLLANWG